MSTPSTITGLSHARRWIPAFAWMAVIFWLSSASRPGLPSGLSSPAHFSVFAVLAALCMIPLYNSTTPGHAVAISVLIASAYGVTDEIHQAFVPGRVPDVADWGFDTLGALAGALLMLALLRSVQSREGRSRDAS